MGQVLLYNLAGDKLRRIQTVLLRHGLRGRSVEKREYGHPIGYLCNMEGFVPGAPFAGEGFRDEMLVLEGLTSRQFSSVLDALRTARAAVALKAVVTPTNAAWTSAELHDAILKEHNIMHGLRTKNGK